MSFAGRAGWAVRGEYRALSVSGSRVRCHSACGLTNHFGMRIGIKKERFGMTQRIWNFSAGPAVLPESVLEEARNNLLSLGETGIGILEHSHRGKAFLAVYEETEALVREVGAVPAG